MQRFDADAVAGEKQRPGPGVPDREAEHAAQARDGGGSPLLVGVHDRFRVGGGIETVPGGFELAPELTVVVDLAVEDDPDGAVFVVNRLVPSRQIDDAQTPHSQRHAVGRINSLIVRAAVPDDVTHLMRKRMRCIRRQRIAGRSRFDEPGDAAHTINSPFSPRSARNAVPTCARSPAAAHVRRRTRAPRIPVR